MRTALLLALVATSALAEPAGTPRSRSVSLSTTDANAVHATTGALTLYVDPTGNDGNSCIATGTGACLTIQGALNKAPKVLRHQVTISVAAGTYGCFYVNGFTCDTGYQSASGGLAVDALSALTTSTLATGTATGTATASSAGSGTTFGTLTDGAQTWTVNDLAGRFVTAAGQTRVISSNTATAITIVGTWTSPGTVAYTVQDPGVVINTGCVAPANPTSAVSSAKAAIWVTNNVCSPRLSMFLLRGIRTTNNGASESGVVHDDQATLNMTLMQLRSPGNAELWVSTNPNSDTFTGTARTALSDIDMLQSGAANPAIILSGGYTTVTRVLARGAHVAVSISGAHPVATFANLEDQADVSNCVRVLSGELISVTGSRLDCDASHSAFEVSGISALNARPAYANIGEAFVSSACGTGLTVGGHLAAADASGLTGSAATTGIAVLNGGSVSFSSGTTISGGTSAISLDSGAVTAALADVTAGTCLQAAQSNSKVCAR